MSDALGDGVPAATPVWTNDFPQSKSRWGWLEPGISIGMGIIFLASILSGGSASLIANNTLFGITLLLLSTPSAMKLYEHRRPNSIWVDGHGRSVVCTRLMHEILFLAALTVLFLGAAALVMWYWDPYSFLPFQTDISRFRQGLMLYCGVFLLLSAMLTFGSRPWRRRLVFSPDGLAYRRFGPTVFIPWDTIETVTPVNGEYLQAAVITARPPAQLPALERKRLPSGATRAKLAIYGMTVDPATIVYLIRRFAADPDARELLATSKYPERLFTGPSWNQRVAMEDGQTWPTPRLEDLAAD